MYQLNNRRNFLTSQNKPSSRQSYSQEKWTIKHNNFNQNYHTYMANSRSPKESLENRNFLFKSRMNNLYGSTVPTGQQLFSEELLFLLSHQQQNLDYFKQKIFKQKQKVERDFANFLSEIKHIVEDLKTSIHAQLDKSYKTFIDLYAKMKFQVNQFRKFRRQIIQNKSNNPQIIQLLTNKSRINVSNKDILDQLQKDAQMLQNHRLYNHLNLLQQQKLTPILELTNKIIILGAPEKYYYQDSNTYNYLTQFKQTMKTQINSGFQQIGNLVYNCQKIIEIQEKLKTQNSNFLKSSINNPNTNSQVNQYQQINPYGINYGHSQYKTNLNLNNKHQNSQNSRNIFQPSYSIPNLHPNNHFTQFNINIKDVGYHKQTNLKRPYSESKVRYSSQSLFNETKYELSKDQQNVTTQYVQQMELENDKVINGNQHSDILLCCVFIKNDKYLATGSKDKSINIYDVNNGKFVLKLLGHNASICCLANLGQFLASGGDNGCSCLIIWDLTTWKIKSRMQGHSTAVTCIVNLEDGNNLITGGYDTKLNIVNYQKSNSIFSLPNKRPVSGGILSGDKHRFITSGLDSSLSVWRINKTDNKLDSITIERVIMSNSLVCSIRSLSLCPDHILAATKDGRIHIINIITQKTFKTLNTTHNSVLEMITLERKTNPKYPLIFSCSTKQKLPFYNKSELDRNLVLNINRNLNIEYGCGIGPKAVFSSNSRMAIVSQSSQAKQILIFKVKLS